MIRLGKTIVVAVALCVPAFAMAASLNKKVIVPTHATMSVAAVQRSVPIGRSKKALAETYWTSMSLSDVRTAVILVRTRTPYDTVPELIWDLRNNVTGNTIKGTDKYLDDRRSTVTFTDFLANDLDVLSIRASSPERIGRSRLRIEWCLPNAHPSKECIEALKDARISTTSAITDQRTGSPVNVSVTIPVTEWIIVR